MARFKTIDDLAVAGKRVLVRADLNVPMQDGEVSDATRIERLVPTLLELADKGARVVVLSHFGRPKGKADAAYSLRPLVGPLSAALGGRSVAFAGDCVGEAAKAVVDGLEAGGIALQQSGIFHFGSVSGHHAAASRVSLSSQSLSASSSTVICGAQCMKDGESSPASCATSQSSQ